MKSEVWISNKLQETEGIVEELKKANRKGLSWRYKSSNKTHEFYEAAIKTLVVDALFSGRAQALREVLELEEFDAAEIEGVQ